MTFTNDAFLWYNVPGFESLGLAVPNFGNDKGTQNQTILELTQMIGRNMQNIMFHTDASLRTPPTINTIVRICKLCVRGRDLLFGRAIPSGTPNMESMHAIPAYEQFLVYPTPYFKVRNMYLKSYCGLMLTALTEAFQHQENARGIEISSNFAGLIGQYIRRVYKRVGVELLSIDAAKFDDPAFKITDTDFAAYNPAAFFTQTEMIDTVPLEVERPTEDDIEPITNGIPIDLLPVMGRYPGTSGLASNNQNGSTTSSARFVEPGTP